ncbi:MAG: BamA/OMP85 family outer membrane protein, partial [Thermoguttaceae bacterium]
MTGYSPVAQASFDNVPAPAVNPPAMVAPAAGPTVPGIAPASGPAPPPPSAEVVAEVRVVGNKRTPTEKLMRHIQTRAGRPYNAELVDQDVLRLNRSGLVDSVRAQYQDAPNGRGRIVVYEVFERPSIKSVHYVGNRKIKSKTLTKEAKLKAGDPLEPFAVEEARNRLEAFYKDKGFANVRVTISEGSKITDQRVVFVVNEGSKQTILWTSFEGNTIASESRLRTQIKSKQGVVWLFGGELNRRQIEEDKDRLVDYYHRLGFFRARVGSIIEEHPYSDQRDWVTLKFVIDEGPRYAIRNLSVVGNSRIDTVELLKVMELKQGQPYRDDWMRRDENAIKDRYGAVGYVFADVKPEIVFDEQPGHLDLVFKIEEGERYRGGKIDVDIAGEYPHTQITTVLNRLSLEPGDIIDIRELRDSQRRLRSSQLFKVDPQSGAMPEIAFSPPTPDEIEKAKAQLARRQAEAGQFRGQDPPTGLLRALSQPPVESGDRWYNLTVVPPKPGGPSPATSAAPGMAAAQGPPPATGPVDLQQEPARGDLARRIAPQPDANEVVRFQYSADGGSATP